MFNSQMYLKLYNIKNEDNIKFLFWELIVLIFFYKSNLQSSDTETTEEIVRSKHFSS